MTVFGAAVVYICLWWLVFILSLPVGVHSTQEAGESGARGHDAGAPVRHHLKLKLLATTVIATLLWGVAYWMISTDLFPFGGH